MPQIVHCGRSMMQDLAQIRQGVFDEIKRGSKNMLLRYKKAFEKISMGLLSFMPQEKDMKKLLETIHQYETNPEWHLFVWKEEEDFIGIIGVRVDETIGIIQHISVSPSHRGEGIGKEMIQTLPNILHTSSIQPSEEIKSFFEKCQIEKEED